MLAVGIRITLRAVALTAVALSLAFGGEGVLTPHGLVGGAEFTILPDTTAIVLAVVIPVIRLTIAFSWWFRAGKFAIPGV
jgi:cytochrome o ubiquinol oxidase subunit 2